MQYCGKEAQVNLLLATFADVGNSEVRKNTGRISPAIKNKKQEAVHIRFIDHISNVKIVTPRNKMSNGQVALLNALMRAKR